MRRQKKGAHSIRTPVEALVCPCRNAEEAPQSGAQLPTSFLVQKIWSFLAETSVKNYVNFNQLVWNLCSDIGIGKPDKLQTYAVIYTWGGCCQARFRIFVACHGGIVYFISFQI